MFRLSGLLLIGFAVFVGSLLFETSQSVQRAEQELADIERALKEEGESHRVLTAEWDYLNRPERLEKLTKRNLDIDKVEGDNKAGFMRSNDSIPEPRIPVLPGIKPTNLLQYAGGKKKTPETPKDKTIQNAEADNFYEIMAQKEGGQ